LNVEYPSDLINIYCDFEKIVIALLNILINAIEAIENDNGKISIKVKTENDVAVIEMLDNGSGIEEENIPRLFEPYYTSKRNGIGLGLASTLNIVQAHGGSIEVTSEISKYTNFTITLPVKPFK